MKKAKERNSSNAAESVNSGGGPNPAKDDGPDLAEEIRSALVPVYPPPRTPRVVLVPTHAFFTMAPELREEWRGIKEEYPFILVHNGTITPALIH